MPPSPASLKDVMLTNELRRRTSRAPDFEAENRAFLLLMDELAAGGETVLQTLAETILQSCRADSAGISILRPSKPGGPEEFYWAAITGPFAQNAGGTMRRDFSPCGIVVERNSLVLFDRPARHFPALAAADPPIFENLAVPFQLHGRPAGTVWAINHTPEQTFDPEDARLLTSLSHFAATGYQLHTAIAETTTARDKQNREAHARTRELEDMRRLQETAARLIGEGQIEALLEEIQDTSLFFAQADRGSMQMVDPETGELLLLTSRGLSRELTDEFKRIKPGASTPCAMALASRKRVVIPDIAANESPIGIPIKDAFTRNGVRTSQSTPLLLRSGKVVGVLSTHWSRPHQPTERQLRLIDLLARQAADLIERCQTEKAMRQSEEKLRTLSTSLEKQVAKRTAELEEKTTRLQDLATELTSAEHRERKRLAALLHDDLQQLLVAAKIQINPLRRRLEGDPDIEIVEKLATWISKATHAARDLTRQLRPPALYEDGLVASLKWLASEIKDRQGLRVAIHACDGEHWLTDDHRALLFDCVRELLFNTAKYAGVDSAILEMKNRDGSLHLVVSDNGRGFDVSTLSRDKSYGSYGLFSIRERLVALGGNMTIESGVDLGTRVELEVPLKHDLAPTSNGTRMAPLVHTETGDGTDRAAVTTDCRTSVLVVDDHALVREGIATIVNGDERLQVVGQAADGLEAIAFMEKNPAEIVLLDLNMPRMNGIEAAKEITRKWPATNIIGLSVQDDETTSKAMLNAGATAFLPKTGAAEKLIEALVAFSNEEATVSNEHSATKIF